MHQFFGFFDQINVKNGPTFVKEITKENNTSISKVINKKKYSLLQIIVNNIDAFLGTYYIIHLNNSGC